MGGHLTHGSPVNFSGKLYNTSFYNVEEDTGKVDYNKIEETVILEQPKLIICGAYIFTGLGLQKISRNVRQSRASTVGRYLSSSWFNR